MSKKKSDSELLRFSWKRNAKYDLSLLYAVLSKNPYASQNQLPVWNEVADYLKENELKMRVTGRGCRDRVADLLKRHRQKEVESERATGIDEEPMTELNFLLTSVDQLEKTKPDKASKNLYARNDHTAAEAIRSSALAEVSKDRAVAVAIRLSEDGDTYDDSEDDENFFEPKKSRTSNPKKDLILYLEKKSQKEIELHKEELQIQKKEKENKAKEYEKELELRKEELQIRKQETENKAKELEILRLKTNAEIDERAKFNEAILKLITKD